ncbi:MAG: class I SAM-dependent methyltransferase [Candidatus Accumulibacter sp.]|uniref:Class I SAM-dependent methyltransferase n=1 Tax=Candidatus Accumulibacter proximus TaxID=2954385 RepID=A0A935PX44_9PROT|nr:class I SAM-dependent methyltransferase [Candidatus Accumulibacter proximus]
MGNREQTLVSFRDKWEQNKELAFSETLKEGSDIFNWILTRNGVPSPEQFVAWLNGKARILDAGCGNGRVTALLQRYAPQSASIVGIDLTAAAVAAENLRELKNVETRQKDLLGDLADLGLFDLIYCQEVLHHTADPKGAFLNLCQRLAPNGEIAIYVYKLKAPLREYADDYIRAAISSLPYDHAMKEMHEITLLGKALSDLDVKVTLPGVKVLGIEAGEYDIQRFLYHFFLKCFWNPSLSMDENVAINYDWYHPQLCTRHTLDEVLGWFADAGLSVIHHCVDHYGITVRGVRRS